MLRVAFRFELRSSFKYTRISIKFSLFGTSHLRRANISLVSSIEKFESKFAENMRMIPEEEMNTYCVIINITFDNSSLPILNSDQYVIFRHLGSLICSHAYSQKLGIIFIHDTYVCLNKKYVAENLFYGSASLLFYITIKLQLMIPLVKQYCCLW